MKRTGLGDAPIKHLGTNTRPKHGADMDKPEGPIKQILRRRLRRMLKRNTEKQ